MQANERFRHSPGSNLLGAVTNITGMSVATHRHCHPV